MDFFSSVETRQRLSGLHFDLSNHETTLDSLSRQLMSTELRLNKAMLAVEALVELMSEHEMISREEILKRMGAIDLRDGKLDGKVTPDAVDCTACHRPISPKLAKCLYCGEERPPGAGVLS